MKILMMSDTHQLVEEVIKIKAAHPVDYMIHCGDSELPMHHEALEGMLTVKGNCDIDGLLPELMIQEIAGWRLLLTHGHRYGVKNTLQRLHYAALEHGAQIVCFGHTHLLYVEKVEDVLYINPGSIRFPHIGHESTYVILTLKEETAAIEVFNISGEKIKTETFSKPLFKK